MTPDRGPWIQTYSGRALHLLDPRPDEVTLEDVAHALAYKTRFTGHAKHHYSVAQHCVLGADYILRTMPGRTVPALAFLLHELGEVYLPDVASPLKPSLTVAFPGPSGVIRGTWEGLEALHTRAILRALDLPGLDREIHSPFVKRVDRAMLMAEAPVLLGGLLPGWGYAYVPPASVTIDRWSPAVAESQWLAAYRWLRGVR